VKGSFGEIEEKCTGGKRGPQKRLTRGARVPICGDWWRAWVNNRTVKRRFKKSDRHEERTGISWDHVKTDMRGRTKEQRRGGKETESEETWLHTRFEEIRPLTQ